MGIFIGILTILIAITSYSFYLTDVYKRKTKPHGFTWFIWASLNSFIFYEQITHGGGPGAWVTAVAALANGIICLSAFRYGEKNITRLDWLCLCIALIALMIWVVDENVTLSVILASSVFVIGFIPTIRKSLKKAHEETVITFALNGLKFLLALFALSSFTITTALYPIILAIVNGTFAIFLFWRQLTSQPQLKMKHLRK